MEDKVCSYELAKQLHDLKFECKSHCGWWEIYPFGEANWRDREEIIVFHKIKAYDCHDLLMWLRDRKTYKGMESLNINITDFDFSPYEALTESYQPQEALAKAVIEILKEKLNV